MDENWFYLDSQQGAETRRVGPLSRKQIEELAQQGTITKDALVWYPGLVTWLAWKEVAPEFPGNAPEHSCTVCMITKPETALVYKDSRWICKSCQEASAGNGQEMVPELMAQMQPQQAPGVVPSSLYAPFGIRLAATLIDLMILGTANAILVILYLFFFHIPQEVLQSSLAINIPGLVLEAAYQVYFLSQFGGTPGKMLLGLRVVTADGKPLTPLTALGRYFAYWLSALTLGLGFLLILFDPERRALHDHIAGTRVQFFRASIR